MRADDRPDLRHELGLAAVDLAAALDEPLGDVVRLDVLDEEDVGAGLAAMDEVGDQTLERAAG